MEATLALLHTTAVTVPALKELAAQHLPGVRLINLLDDSLLADVIAEGGIPEAVEERLAGYVDQAAIAGATAVMSACSSIGEAMERIAQDAPIPVWRIDEAMAEAAAATGGRIGVLATVKTTLLPTANLIRRKADALRSATDVEAVLVEGAFEALGTGRGAEHDQLVRAALEALLGRSDLVVLAQASMARLLTTLSAPPRVPVLTSSVSGLQRAAAKLSTSTAAGSPR